MASDLRVPPAVTLEFRQIANDICNRAKLDYDDWAHQADELTTHLQERWRDGIDDGLSTEGARQKVLEGFGDRSLVAKSLRRPWYVRLLSYDRYRPHRYISFLAAYCFCCWVTIYCAVLPLMAPPQNVKDAYTYLDDRLDSLLMPFRPDFFLTGFGMLFVGVLATASAIFIQWQPRFKAPLLNRVLYLRNGLIAIIVLAIAQLAFMPLFSTLTFGNPFEFYIGVDWLSLWHNLMGLLRIIAIILGWCGALCLIAELCGTPGNPKLRAPHYSGSRQRPRISYGALALWTAVVALLAGMTAYPTIFPKSRFCERIVNASSVVVREPPYKGITLTGKDAALIMEALSRGSRDLLTSEPPYLVRYFELTFLNGTNVLGTVPSNWGTFLIDGKPYSFTATDSGVLKSLVFEPAHDYAGAQWRGEHAQGNAN